MLNVSPSPHAVSPTNGVSTSRAFWFAAAVTIVVFLLGILAPYFIVDSWSYLELSNTIFKDFYRYNTLRQFENPSPYSQAFPPLWPVLLALVRKLADLGIYTGYLINFAVCVALLALLMRLFHRINSSGWVGAACYLSIFAYRPFLVEALGGKTIPLSVTLLAGALLILFREQITMPRISMAGLLMGLACLTRFDALPPACFIGVVFIAHAYRLERRFRRCVAVGAIYFAAFGITLSPLVAYGMTHFGKVFPSDNTRMLTEARGGTVLDYHKAPPASDLVQNPGRWMAGLVFHKAPKVALGFYEAASESLLPVFMAVVFVVWGATRSPLLPAPALRFSVLALILIPVMLLAEVLVGFLDIRYYAGPGLLLFAVLYVVLVSLTADVWSPRRVALLLLVTALLLCEVVIRPVVLNRRGPTLSLTERLAPLSPTLQMRQVTDAVNRDSSGQPHRILFTEGFMTSAKYGALTGEPTTLMPRLVDGTFADFVRDWHITHVYDGPIKRAPWEKAPSDQVNARRDIDTGGVELVPLDLPYLFRIRIPAPDGALHQGR